MEHMLEELKKDIFYKFLFRLDGDTRLTYKGKIVTVDDHGILFVDKFGMQVYFKLNLLEQIVELPEEEQGEPHNK